MAIPQEALDIQAKRVEILEKVEALKAESRALKRQFDRIVETANFKHKFGQLTEHEKTALKEML